MNKIKCGSGIDASSEQSENEAIGLAIIEQLVAEVQGIKEEDFGKWYEKKRKLFNIGIKKPPTKEEFIKYLNYASSIFLM